MNLALVLKFMPDYLFAPPGVRRSRPGWTAADDDFLFRQGPARGLGKVASTTGEGVRAAAGLPNVARLSEQAEAFATLLTTAAPGMSNRRTWTSRWTWATCSRWSSTAT